MDLKKIDLNDLPTYSQWPERMLGLSPWTVKTRTLEKTEAEYNVDKYMPCLNKFEESMGKISMEEIKKFELGDDASELCISFGDELFLTTFGNARKKYYEEIRQVLKPSIEKSRTVIELAAGYGYNLWMLAQEFTDPSLKWIGGEFAENAIELGNKLAGPNAIIEKFNFYETPYNLLSKVEGPITIFSVFGTQQLPSAKDVLLGLRPYKDKIERVVYFESVYEHCDSLTILGLMRKRYIELCDYNTDMLTILRSSDEVEIISERRNVIGLNPLLPASIIEWKFK